MNARDVANNLPLSWDAPLYSVSTLRLVPEAFLLSDARGCETTGELWLENNVIAAFVADKMKELYEAWPAGHSEGSKCRQGFSMPLEHGLATLRIENQETQDCWRGRNVELFEGTVKLDSPTPSLLDKDWFCAAKGDKEQGR